MKKLFLLYIAIALTVSGQAQLLTKKEVFTRADTLRGMLTPLRTCYDVNFYHLDVKFDIAHKFSQKIVCFRNAILRV